MTVGPNDTAATLSARMLGTDRKLDLFRMLNDLQMATPLRPGDRVKIITE